jgi:hypothetical protein
MKRRMFVFQLFQSAWNLTDWRVISKLVTEAVVALDRQCGGRVIF